MSSWIAVPGGLSREEQSGRQWVELSRPVLQGRGWHSCQVGCGVGRALLPEEPRLSTFVYTEPT